MTSCSCTFCCAATNFFFASGFLARRLRTGLRRREPGRRGGLVGLGQALERRDVLQELAQHLLVALGRRSLFIGLVGEDVARLDLAGPQTLGEAEHVAESDRQPVNAVAHFVQAALDLLGDRDFLLARQQRDAAHLLQIHAHRVGAVGAVISIRRADLGDHRKRRLVFLADFLDGGGHFGLVDAPIGLVAEERVIGVVRGGGRAAAGLLGEALDDLDVVVGENADRVLQVFREQILLRRDSADVLVGDEASLASELDQAANALLDRGVGGSLARAFVILFYRAGFHWARFHGARFHGAGFHGRGGLCLDRTRGFRHTRSAIASGSLVLGVAVRAHKDPLNCIGFVKLRRRIFGVKEMLGTTASRNPLRPLKSVEFP